MGFDVNVIKENVEVLINDLKKVKLFFVKGVYFKKVMFFSIMGSGLVIDFVFLVM